MAAEAYRSQTLVFDVNETLLDLQQLAPLFDRHLGDAALLKEWFRNLLLYSQTVTLAGTYLDFSALAKAALQMTARMHGRELTEEGEQAIFGALRSVPVHTEVAAALEALRSRGYRLVAFTNSTQAGVEEQLKNAGVAHLFDRILSVGAWKKFKPATALYQEVAATLGINTAQITMVAAHAWDLMGARSAGCQTAFIERVKGSWFPAAENPEIWASDLNDLARRLP